MQQVMVNIENKELEEMLLEEANKKGRKLAAIILDVLENNFLRKKEPGLRYRKLDPLKHMSRIEVESDNTDDDLTDVVPFADIKDSAAYVRELRKNAWRK
jgi:hypothetical protein